MFGNLPARRQVVWIFFEDGYPACYRCSSRMDCRQDDCQHTSRVPYHLARLYTFVIAKNKISRKERRSAR